MAFEQEWNDLRLAARGLWRARGFSLAAVLTLACAIAGTTAMFAIVEGVLLRPLPVREQDGLLVAWKELRSSGFAHYPFGADEIDAVSRASQLLANVAGVTSNGAGRSVIVEDGSAGYVKVALVTGGFFEVLGIDAVRGRAIRRSDDGEGAENVLVISHGLWQRRYGGAASVIGRRVQLAEQPFTIVGVIPPDIDYPRGVEAWRTTRSVPVGGPFGDAARREIDLVARLRPGVALEQAAGELTALTRRFEADAPPNLPRGLVPVVRSFEEVVVGDMRPAIVALVASVGLVLLIASANVANLLLMRGEARRSELALRAALGAGRGRIVRHVLAESLVLALAAAVVALAATWWSLDAAIALIPQGLPRIESVRVDATVFLFTMATAFLTALLSGLAPAASSMRRDLVLQLRRGGPGVAGAPVRRVRRSLVVVQVALAVAVVAGAGLLARSLLRLQSIDTGLAADRLVFVDLAVPPAKYKDRVRHANFLDEVMSRLEAMPSIAAATPVNVPPFSVEGGWDVPRFAAEGQGADRAARNPALNLESVHPNYFETFEVTVVRGRAFTSADREGMPAVAIVSQDVATATWPGEDPIGKRLKMGGADSRAPWYTIVGVAAPTRYRELDKPRPTLYLPAAQFQMTARMLVLRTSATVDRIASLARDAVRSVDADVQVVRVTPFAEMLAVPLARARFNALLLTTFAVTALLLAGIGLYAVMAAHVRQRERELAIRLALGATGARLRRLVLGEALRLAGAGVIAGLAGAAAATQLLRGLLFGVHPLDPASLAGAALLLVTVSAAAASIPAWSATRRDPAAALRAD